jgi:uncharacterized tellurite resistance protein B-like protein
MADWRKLAKALALADGKIDTKETEIIKKELMADGKLDRSEIDWLMDVRKSASGTVHVFDKFVFDALKPIILADGDIDAKEAAYLRKFLYADGKIDDGEKQFLKDLKAGAKKTSPEFEELYKQAVGA